jgi:hypothetical protein
MALWQLGNHLEHSIGGLNLPGNTEEKYIKRFYYNYNHPILPPSLLGVKGGKKYLMPTWERVHPKTEITDIIWDKPKSKKAEVIKHEFKSSSSNKVYLTKEHISVKGKVEYTCNCPGFFRIKDRSKGCKHIKSLKGNG